MPITPGQAEKLLAQGQISKETFDRIAPPIPLEVAPLPTGLQIQPTGPSLLEPAMPPTQVGGSVDASGTGLSDPNLTPGPDLQVPPVITTPPDVLQPLSHSFDAAPAPTDLEPGTPTSMEPAQFPTEAPEEPQFAPGDVVKTTSTQKKATEAAEDAQLALEDSFSAQQDAAEEQAQAGAAQAAQAFGFNQEAQRLEAESSAAEQSLRDKGNAEVAERLAELDAKTAELSDAKYEGYWANRGIGMKIMGAIAVGLGAYSSSVGGGPNHAMNIINASMDDEFKAFQATTKVKLAAIQNSRLSIADKQRLMKDQIIGLQAKKQSDINIVKSKIANLSNKFKGSKQKAALAQMDAQLDQKAAESRLKFENALAETVNTQVTRKVAGGPVDSTPSEGEKAVDKAYAKDFNTFTSKGRKNSLNAINKLEVLQEELVKESRVTFGAGGGPISATMPDMFRTQTSIRLRDDVQNSANSSLKEIFGGQLSDAERTSAAKEFYNDSLDAGENAKILARKIGELKSGLANETEKAVYFSENGTLKGFGASVLDETLKTDKTPGPQGNRVKQNGVWFNWNGTKYIQE